MAVMFSMGGDLRGEVGIWVRGFLGEAIRVLLVDEESVCFCLLHEILFLPIN